MCDEKQVHHSEIAKIVIFLSFQHECMPNKILHALQENTLCLKTSLVKSGVVYRPY